MSKQTQTKMPITDSQEEETMHLFDAEARKEEALCGAETSGRRPDQPAILRAATPIRACRWYLLRAVQASDGHVRQASLPGIPSRRTDEAHEYRWLADTLAKETGLNR